MTNRTDSLLAALMWPSIVVGSIVIGCAIVDDPFLIWPILVGAAVLAIYAAIAYRFQDRTALQDQTCNVEQLPVLIDAGEPDRSVSVSQQSMSTIANGNDSSNLNEAFAVASLVTVLDHTKELGEPGWDDLCASIVRTIANTGDARCLPTLSRVRLARGIEFRDAVDAAIAAINKKQRRDQFGDRAATPQLSR